jgi:two-component system, NtrC family, nitrogen regulation sensor histidine kinase NtrY
MNFMFNFFKLSLFRFPEFSFSQNNIFRHACATPLTILMSNLEEDMVDSNDKSRLSSSVEAVNKLTKIIGSVTENKVVNEKFEVCAAINEVLCLFYEKIDEGCISSRVLVNKKIFLVGNKLYFQEALTCILNNSIEAYGEVDKKPINIILRKMGALLRIDITDYASGMNLVMKRLVLLNGVSTKSKGTGLGLSFVKKTIEEKFFGTMSINSAVNFGTHVALTIPLLKPCNQSP